MRLLGQMPGILAACSLAACAWVLTSELGSFRKAVGSWAERDMRARTQLASDALGSAMATGDFRRIREFGDDCRADGVRLTVLSGRGGVVYDSATTAFGGHRSRPEVEAALASGVGSALRRSQTTREDMFYCARRSGDYVVRLAIPSSRVFAPFSRARIGLVLAGLVGASAVLLVFVYTNRLVARVRKREQQLAEMRRAEEFRREFVANITHEHKTPLTGIMGAVDLLDGEDSLPPDSRHTLFGLLRSESMRLNSLAQDILSLARLEQNQHELHRSFAMADLADVVRGVHARFQPKAAAAGMRLDLASVQPATASCDAQLVEQALANLVENAIRHSGSPDIVLALSVRDGCAVMSVEDHGSGIPPEHRDRVFERFYRVDKDRSREMGGTGLGLAIVKHIAQLHGGTATLAPADGGGCRFELTIPLAANG